MAFFLATQLEMLAEGSLLSGIKSNPFYFSKDIGASHGGDTEDFKGHEILHRESYVSFVNLMKEMIAG